MAPNPSLHPTCYGWLRQPTQATNSNVRSHMRPLLPLFAGATREMVFSLVGMWAKPPSLRITESAKGRLLQEIAQITQFQAVATVLWGASGKAGEFPKKHEVRWSLAFYDRATRPSGRIALIQGVPFVFVQRRAFTHLNGATLDYSNGRYVISESGT
jgi:hypothetical protein